MCWSVVPTHLSARSVQLICARWLRTPRMTQPLDAFVIHRRAIQTPKCNCARGASDEHNGRGDFTHDRTARAQQTSQLLSCLSNLSGRTSLHRQLAAVVVVVVVCTDSSSPHICAHMGLSPLTSRMFRLIRFDLRSSNVNRSRLCERAVFAVRGCFARIRSNCVMRELRWQGDKTTWQIREPDKPD